MKFSPVLGYVLGKWEIIQMIYTTLLDQSLHRLNRKSYSRGPSLSKGKLRSTMQRLLSFYINL